MTAPDRIWATEGDGMDGWENAYATISGVHEFQVEYIRADLHAALQAENERLLEAVIVREAELIYLRKYGKDGARWEANESKDVWREYEASALGRALK